MLKKSLSFCCFEKNENTATGLHRWLPRRPHGCWQARAEMPDANYGGNVRISLPVVLASSPYWYMLEQPVEHSELSAEQELRKAELL